MKGKDQNYINNITEKLKYISKNNAVKSLGNDEGFSVNITTTDIRSGTDRERVKLPLLESFAEELSNKGFEAEIEIIDNSINVFVPPMLDEKDVYSLQDIDERISVVSEINAREEYLHRDE